MKTTASYALVLADPCLDGEANNLKMGLFNDIHEGSGGC